MSWHVRDGLVAICGFRPSLSPEQETLADGIVSEIVAAGAEPPSTAELVASRGDAAALLLGFLQREGRLILLGDRHYDPAIVSSLLQRVRCELAGGVCLAPAELRRRLGVSRRLLIGVLERADGLGMTVRDGDLRRLAGECPASGDDGILLA